MSKVGAAFGGGGGKQKKPSHLEIVAGLAQAARDKELAKSLGGAVTKVANASESKFSKGRLAKAARLKRGGSGGPGGVDDTNDNGTSIKRPGLRTARLLGS